MTWAGITFFAKRVWYFVYDNWKVLAIVAGILLVVVLSAVAFRSCGRKPTKLNEAEIQRGEQAIKEQNKQELVEILAKAEVREQAIDANVANGRVATINAVKEARDKYSDMSIEELQAEFGKGKQ